MCSYIFYVSCNIVNLVFIFFKILLFRFSFGWNFIWNWFDREGVTGLTRYETWILNSRISYPRAIVSFPLWQIWMILSIFYIGWFDAFLVNPGNTVCFYESFDNWKQKNCLAIKLLSFPCIKRRFVLQ